MHFFDPTLTHRPNLYRLSGPDAADYLHRMTTANINALHAGQSTPGLFLTAQGRIKCMFTLHRVAEQEFCVEFETPERFAINFDALIEEFRFAEGISSIEDLHEGMTVPGIVTNITKFGAFVNIGVKQDGMVHVSQMSHNFIKDPNEVVKLGQKVQVTITEVDIERKRVALSMKVNTGNNKSKSNPSEKLFSRTKKENTNDFQDKLQAFKDKLR